MRFTAPPPTDLPAESQNHKDQRVERLWRVLDPKDQGYVDLNGLKRGLRRMDHPLKNADSILGEVMKVVDTSGDGLIQYEEFRVFVEETEKKLWNLFQAIDRNHNGRLDKDELKTALSKANLAVPYSKLDQFFQEVDTNNDGVISFDEWRDFLLFIPQNEPGIKAVWTYFQSTVSVNPEGDVVVSDEREHGPGRRQSFPSTFLEAIASISSSRRHHQVLSRQKLSKFSTHVNHEHQHHNYRSGSTSSAASASDLVMIASSLDADLNADADAAISFPSSHESSTASDTAPVVVLIGFQDVTLRKLLGPSDI